MNLDEPRRRRWQRRPRRRPTAGAAGARAREASSRSIRRTSREQRAERLLAVKALWCTDAECKPETATPLQIKADECDDYVKAKFEDADAVDALRKAQIPVVKCEGGESYSVADAEPERRATVQLEESSMTITPTLPNDFADRIVSHRICEMRQAGQIDALEARPHAHPLGADRHRPAADGRPRASTASR